MTDLERRAYLAGAGATLAGLTGLAGCAALTEDEPEPTSRSSALKPFRLLDNGPRRDDGPYFYAAVITSQEEEDRRITWPEYEGAEYQIDYEEEFLGVLVSRIGNILNLASVSDVVRDGRLVYDVVITSWPGDEPDDIETLLSRWPREAGVPDEAVAEVTFESWVPD